MHVNGGSRCGPTQLSGERAGQRVRGVVRDACGSARVDIFGSAALGADLDSSDVDLVVTSGTLSGPEMLDRLEEAFRKTLVPEVAQMAATAVIDAMEQAVKPASVAGESMPAGPAFERESRVELKRVASTPRR